MLVIKSYHSGIWHLEINLSFSCLKCDYMSFRRDEKRASCPYRQPHPGSPLNQWTSQILSVKRTTKKRKKKKFREKSVILMERLKKFF